MMAAKVLASVSTAFMSAKPMEPCPAYDSWVEADNPALSPRPERRKRERTMVHWPVRLFRNGGQDAVDTITRNLSSEGFYCFSSTAFVPGESIHCTLRLPSHDTTGRTLALHCRVHILRVEAVNREDTFGIACRIDDYHFSDPALAQVH
jgi:PilZ domain-containing protein